MARFVVSQLLFPITANVARSFELESSVLASPARVFVLLTAETSK